MVALSTALGQGRRLPGIIERERLLEQLDGVLDHRVTLICAPPGYGKTTLAAQYASQAPTPVIWQTVDESQRDVYNLHLRALAAVGELFPNVQAREPGGGVTPVELTTSLSDFLRSQGGQDIVYILDDVHHLQGAQSAETWLSSFVTSAPRTCHLILISRTVPDIIQPDMIARREVLPIGQQALRFTSDEVEELTVSLFGGTRMPRPDVDRLVGLLEGWPAGLMLALQPMPAEFVDTTIFGSGTPETLFDALARTMLDAQTPVMRDFLFTSSTLTRMQPELLTSVLDMPNGMVLLNEAMERNLFVAPISGGVAYHGLFRQFLQREYSQREPERFQQQHLRVAHWYEERLLIDDAIFHYISGDGYEDAIRLIELYARSYYDQGKYETLQRWNSTLTERAVFCGWLLYLCAAINTERKQYDEAHANLTQAERLFHQSSDAEGCGRVTLLRAHYDMLQGDYFEAFRKAQEVYDRAADMPHIRAAALRVVGFSRLKSGNVTEAIRSLEAARPLYEAHSDRFALTKLLMDLDIAYRQVGRAQESAECLQELVIIRRELGGQVALAQALNNLGSFQHLRGEYDEAYRSFEEGLRVAARVGDRYTESYLYWSLGDLQRDRGAFEDAVSLYNRALELAGSDEPVVRASVLINLAWLRRWQDHFDDSEQLVQEAIMLSDAHQLLMEGLLARVSQCALQGLSGQAATALADLRVLLERLSSLKAATEYGYALTVAAMLHLLRREKEAAVDAMDAVTKLAKDGVLLQSAIAEITFNSVLSSLVSGSTRFLPLNNAVRALRKAQVQPANIISLGEQLDPTGTQTYALRVQTLGKEIFERDGVLVLATEWRAAAAREIFLYLLFEGEKRREDICLEFWPDKSYEKSRSIFHTTINRARQAVGANVIIRNEDSYGINPEVDLWCDALLFERTVKDARGKPLRDVSTGEMWRRAITLYQGDFLPGVDSDWVVAYRERLNEFYLEALITAGECAQARADFNEAVKLFRQALKVDDLREDVHRSLMFAYRAMGQKQKIKTHYEHMQRLFEEELGVEPSTETVQLVKNLLN